MRADLSRRYGPTFDRARETSPRYETWEKAYTFAIEGRHDEAKRVMAEAEKLGPRRNPFNNALVYGAKGELDQAFAELDQVTLNRSLAAAIKFDAQFDPLRGDQRFKDFLKRKGIEK